MTTPLFHRYWTQVFPPDIDGKMWARLAAYFPSTRSAQTNFVSAQVGFKGQGIAYQVEHPLLISRLLQRLDNCIRPCSGDSLSCVCLAKAIEAKCPYGHGMKRGKSKASRRGYCAFIPPQTTKLHLLDRNFPGALMSNNKHKRA